MTLMSTKLIGRAKVIGSQIQLCRFDHLRERIQDPLSSHRRGKVSDSCRWTYLQQLVARSAGWVS